MTNEEKLNEQISDMANIIKGMFTEEELKQMEESFNVFKALHESSGSKDIKE